jgi:UDP-N-acetylmuramate dehydrogenase
LIPGPARGELADALGERVSFGAPMSRFTSLRVGGPVDALTTPADRAELARLLRICARHRLPHAVLGAGFNTLVLDGPMQGVVIRLSRLRGLSERPGGLLRAEAGVSHSQVTNFCMRHGLAGLEFAAGIPGTVGGWIAMNAGIPAREMRDVVREIEVMSPCGRHRSHLPASRLRFVYRALRGLAPGSLVISALYEVTPSSPERVRSEVARLLALRARSQPLDVPSCGSVFKNPPGDHAGRLIEAAGLKGQRIGGAQISPIHANFIANVEGATSADVLALIRKAQCVVWETARRRLTPEVRILGTQAS